MTRIAQPHATEDLVVVRASHLAALRQLIDDLDNSSDDAGCQDGLTVIDGRPLQKLVEAAEGLRTKPLLQSVHLLHPESEYLDILSVVVPPEVTTEQAREQVLKAARLVTQGLDDSADPDQEAFLAEVRTAGLWIDNGFNDLGIGAWDGPVPLNTAPDEAKPQAAGDLVFVAIQEGGATGELYLSAWPTREEAETFRFSCRDEGSYRTSPMIEVPRRLTNQPFYELVEQFMRSAVLDLGFPEGEAPTEADPNGAAQPTSQRERHAQ